MPVNQVAFIDDDDVLRDANVQTLQLAGFVASPRGLRLRGSSPGA